MIEWLIKTSLKFVSYETLVKVLAQGIAYILEYARTRSTKEGWEVAKSTIGKIKTWITLFDEVYEDDTLTLEEEKKIQDMIASCNTTNSIYELLQGKKKKEFVESKKPTSRKRVKKLTSKNESKKIK